jgi:hypothetical protein
LGGQLHPVAIALSLFHERGFNVEAVGRDATWIAEQAGFKVAAKTRVLVTPIEFIGMEEPLSKEKLCPVLAMSSSDSRQQAIEMARAVLRLSGAGHSAAIHCIDPQTILDFAGVRLSGGRQRALQPGAAGFAPTSRRLSLSAPALAAFGEHRSAASRPLTRSPTRMRRYHG